jgi:hypothetical protein
MKFNIFLFVSALVISGVAQAGSDTHGGDPCEQSVTETYSQLDAKLSQQLEVLGEDLYQEVKWGVYEWFRERTLIKLVPGPIFVDGVEKAARSFRKIRTIELSRKKWCELSDIRKESVLFHEHLVMAEVERTMDYHVSSRYISNMKAMEDKKLEMTNAKKWACQSNAYMVLSNNKLVIRSDAAFKEYNGAYSPDRLPPFFGPTPAVAFNRLLKGSGFRYTGHIFCKKVVPTQKDPDSDSERALCIEEATISNSCVPQF